MLARSLGTGTGGCRCCGCANTVNAGTLKTDKEIITTTNGAQRQLSRLDARGQ
jgi:hypothetical protein